MKIAEIMTRTVVTLTPEQTLRDAVELLRSKHIRHLPVVEDSRLIGIVTDKERGLVPAVKRVFPQVPYQLCHTHFLKNCAKPLATEFGCRPAPVMTPVPSTVALTLSLNDWMRALVLVLGVVLFCAAIVVTAPLQVTTTGPVPLVEHTAHASEHPINAAAKTAATAPVLSAAFRAPIHWSESAS